MDLNFCLFGIDQAGLQLKRGFGCQLRLCTDGDSHTSHEGSRGQARRWNGAGMQMFVRLHEVLPSAACILPPESCEAISHTLMAAQTGE